MGEVAQRRRDLQDERHVATQALFRSGGLNQ
jgi:hypothetical protein